MHGDRKQIRAAGGWGRGMGRGVAAHGDGFPFGAMTVLCNQTQPVAALRPTNLCPVKWLIWGHMGFTSITEVIKDGTQPSSHRA